MLALFSTCFITIVIVIDFKMLRYLAPSCVKNWKEEKMENWKKSLTMHNFWLMNETSISMALMYT